MISKREIIIITFELLKFCVLLLCIIGLSNLSSISTDTLPYITSIGRNWNSGPLINAFTAQGECPNNKTLINDQWAGTRISCWYIDSNNTFNFQEGQCPGRRHSSIPGIPSIPYTKWRGNKLCADRLSQSYFDLSITEKYCPKDHKLCGAVDSFNNQLCVPLNVQCPFNQLIVIPSGLILPAGNWTKVTLNGVEMLFSNIDNKPSSTVEKDLILNQFIIQEDVPCTNPYYYNYIYPLFVPEKYSSRPNCLKIDGKKKDFIYDAKAIEVDKYDFIKVYKENGIYDALLTQYTSLLKKEYKFNPDFNSFVADAQEKNRNLKLFKKGYTGVSIKCLSFIKENNIGDSILISLNNFETGMTGLNNLVFISFILCTVGFGIVILFYLIGILVQCVCPISDGRKSSYQCIYLIITIISNLLILTGMIFNIIVLSKFGNVSITHKILIDQNCIDKSSVDYELMSNSLSYYYDYKYWITFCLIFYISII